MTDKTTAKDGDEVIDRTEMTDEQIRAHRSWHVCSCGRCGMAFAMDDPGMEIYVPAERLVKLGGTFLVMSEKERAETLADARKLLSGGVHRD